MAVIDFQSEKAAREPHLSGEALCEACGHECVVAAPIGVKQPMECSKCGAEASYLKYLVERYPVWCCGNCGSSLVRVAPQGPYCARCGQWFDPNEMLGEDWYGV